MRASGLLVPLALASPITAQAPTAQAPSAQVPRDTYERWITTLSNAGRWGDRDELGTLNLITPAKRRRAAALVKDGVSISLAHELTAGPDSNAIAPMELRYLVNRADSVVTWSLDEIRLLYHGWAYSHIDALSHTGYRGQLYNRFGTDQLTATGAARLGIQTFQAGIVTRGVLVDLPRLKGVPFLPPGTVFGAADLEQWERQHALRVEPGDVLLIRTGRWARAQAEPAWRPLKETAGPHPSLAAWLKARGVAALGGDVSNEFYPPLVAGLDDPLHELALVALGMPLMDNLDFEALAQEAAKRSRYTFLFVAAPLRVRGGSGSPLNPLAIF